MFIDTSGLSGLPKLPLEFHLRSGAAQLGLNLKMMPDSFNVAKISNFGPHTIIVPRNKLIPLVNAYWIYDREDREMIKKGLSFRQIITALELFSQQYSSQETNHNKDFLRISKHPFFNNNYCLALLTDPENFLRFKRPQTIELSSIGSGTDRESHHRQISLENRPSDSDFPFNGIYALVQTPQSITYPPGYGMLIIGGASGEVNKDGIFEPEIFLEHGTSSLGGRPQNTQKNSHSLIGELLIPQDFIGNLTKNKNIAILVIPVKQELLVKTEIV